MSLALESLKLQCGSQATSELGTTFRAPRICYRTRSRVSIAEAWYDPSPVSGVDVVRYFGLNREVDHASRSEGFPTLWIDLQRAEDELFRNFNRTTRSEIRQAHGFGYH